MDSPVNKGFIAQTARDYDMDEEIVERIYNQSKNSTEFYEKLEEYIANRMK